MRKGKLDSQSNAQSGVEFLNFGVRERADVMDTIKIATFHSSSSHNGTWKERFSMASLLSHSMRLKIIGMTSGKIKNDFLIRFAVDHYPIALNMAICKTFVITGKTMLTAMFRQGLIPNKINYYIVNLIHILTALFHKLEVFFKLVGKGKVEQCLDFQIFPCFFKRGIPFCRFLSIKNRVTLRNRGKSFGVKRRICCMKRALPISTIYSGFDFRFHVYSHATNIA